MTISAVLIHTNGIIQFLELEPGYKAIQQAVGGTFDLVTSESGETSFWLHDEGKLIGLRPNMLATHLLWRLNPSFRQRDILVGPILITGGADDQGETLGLSDEGRLAINQL